MIHLEVWSTAHSTLLRKQTCSPSAPQRRNDMPKEDTQKPDNGDSKVIKGRPDKEEESTDNHPAQNRNQKRRPGAAREL